MRSAEPAPLRLKIRDDSGVWLGLGRQGRPGSSHSGHRKGKAAEGMGPRYEAARGVDAEGNPPDRDTPHRRATHGGDA
jgi:hypothetical protein